MAGPVSPTWLRDARIHAYGHSPSVHHHVFGLDDHGNVAIPHSGGSRERDRAIRRGSWCGMRRTNLRYDGGSDGAGAGYKSDRHSGGPDECHVDVVGVDHHLQSGDFMLFEFFRMAVAGGKHGYSYGYCHRGDLSIQFSDCDVGPGARHGVVQRCNPWRQFYAACRLLKLLSEVIGQWSST
jgi:hypothetical protein